MCILSFYLWKKDFLFTYYPRVVIWKSQSGDQMYRTFHFLLILVHHQNTLGRFLLWNPFLFQIHFLLYVLCLMFFSKFWQLYISIGLLKTYSIESICFNLYQGLQYLKPTLAIHQIELSHCYSNIHSPLVPHFLRK